MTPSAAQPWHVRHKGKLEVWTQVGVTVGILAGVAALLPPVRAVVAAACLRLGPLVRGSWNWLGVSHGLPGWLIVLMTVFMAGLVVAVTRQGIPGILPRNRSAEAEADCLALSLKATDFAVNLEGIQWRGHIGEDGRIIGLASHCPTCQFRIKPEVAHRPMYHASIVTGFHCLDCGETNKQLNGTSLAIKDVISRKIEAQWRRGELTLEAGQ